MKRNFSGRVCAAVLAVMLAVSCAAAEGIVIQQMPQNLYIGTVLMTEESYPQVRLSTQRLLNFVIMGETDVPLLCFPDPADMLPMRFSMNSAQFANGETKIEYDYELTADESHSGFIKGAEAKKNILMNNEDGMSAYVRPNAIRAYGLVDMDRYAKGAKLKITIRNNMDMEEEALRQALSDAIIAEMYRVRDEAAVVSAPFWSDGLFSGIHFVYCNDKRYTVDMEFPVLSVPGDSEKTAGLTVHSLKDNQLDGLYDFGGGQYADIIVKGIDERPYAVSRMTSGDPDTFVISAPGGREWYVHAYDISRKGKSVTLYLSALLGFKGEWDRECAFTVEMSGHSISWTRKDLESLVAVLDGTFALNR